MLTDGITGALSSVILSLAALIPSFAREITFSLFNWGINESKVLIAFCSCDIELVEDLAIDNEFEPFYHQNNG